MPKGVKPSCCNGRRAFSEAGGLEADGHAQGESPSTASCTRWGAVLILNFLF